MKTRRIVKRSQLFVLGRCNCGCRKDITIRTKRGYLMRYENGHSAPKVKYNCNKCRDQNWLISCKCGDCNDVITLRDKFYVIREYELGHHNKPMRFQKGDKNPQYKGGRIFIHGYWSILNPYDEYTGRFKSRYIREHIYFFQKYHKCCLLPWAQIHHKDFNKENNTISNLEGMTVSQHAIIHNTIDTSDRKCQFCHPYTVFGKNNIHWHEINGKWSCHRCYCKYYRKLKKQNKK